MKLIIPVLFTATLVTLGLAQTETTKIESINTICPVSGDKNWWRHGQTSLRGLQGREDWLLL